MKIKRDYQLMQFLLDCFSAFQVYLIIVSVIDCISVINQFNKEVIVASGGDAVRADPEPIVIWGVLAVLVYAVAVALPFIFKRVTKMSQKQFNAWVYAVLLVRVLVLVFLMEMEGMHKNYIMRDPESIFNLQVLAHIVLIIIIIRFTSHRIKLMQPANFDNSDNSDSSEGENRTIVED